jgi:hypothetical protein
MSARRNDTRSHRAGRIAALATVVSCVVAAAGTTTAPSAHAANGPSVPECLNASEASLKSRAQHKLKDARAQALVCASRTCPADVRTECTKRVTELNGIIPTLVFEVKDPNGEDVPGVKVTIDGDVFAERLDGTAVPVDPGEHAFTFAANDKTVSKTLVIREGDKGRRERIVLGEKAPPPPTNDTSAAAPATTDDKKRAPETPQKSDSGMSGMRIGGLVAGGVGLVGIGLGTYFGVTASSAWNNSKSECSTTSCPNHAQAVVDHDSAANNGLASTISFAAGGALLASGILLFVLAPSGDKKERAGALSITPSIAPGATGVSLSGRFQ